MWSKDINQFINKMVDRPAPLNSGGIFKEEYKGYKYPYMPILVISIITNINDINLLFNNKIFIDENSPITHTYYELLSNSDIFFSHLKSQKSKSNWYDLFDNKIKKQVVFNIFDQPVPALKIKDNDFFDANKKDKWVMFNVDYDYYKKEELKNYLLEKAKLSLWKCLPDYKGLSISEIIDYKGYLFQKILDGSSNSVETKLKSRKYQHIFSKIIFERDQKCMICCLDLPELLQAAHIMPYSKCDNDIDRYCENNGILLCCNHHKLYDRGFFTFTNDWKVKVSKELEEKDLDLLIKEFEPCFINLSNKFSIGSTSKYIEYHNRNVFRN